MCDTPLRSKTRKAAQTALNIETAAKEISEATKTFLIKIVGTTKKDQTRYLATLPDKLGVVKLTELRKVARQNMTPIEEARAYAKYFGLIPDSESFEYLLELPRLKKIGDLSQNIGVNPVTNTKPEKSRS